MHHNVRLQPLSCSSSHWDRITHLAIFMTQDPSEVQSQRIEKGALTQLDRQVLDLIPYRPRRLC